MSEKNKEKKKISFWKVLFIILLILIILVLIAVAVGYFYINNKFTEIQTNTEKIDIQAVGITEEVKENLEEYRNIALLGIDSRADNYDLGNRSDCIIIASINNKTKDVKLISVYRDTYVDVDEEGTTRLDKITHAYSFGGPQNTLKSLNQALDLNITEYVTVNFDAVISAIDELGGVTIDVTSEELKYINGYINELTRVTGVSSDKVTSAGTQVLNGVQAVAYSRIRYTSGGDHRRTERMRTVIQAMLSKAKSLSITKLGSFANAILPRIRTNISTNELWSLIPTLASFDINQSIGWPYETKGITLDRWYGIPITLESNVIKLHQEVFNQPDYVPSDLIKDMSKRIINKTGYTN